LQVVSLVVVNTTLCPAAAVVTLTIFALALGEHTEIGDLLNAALGGLVSITANCNVVEPWAALLIGIIGGLVYRYSAKLLLHLQIDDVINASPVHFFCGVWGLLATGLFADPKLGGMPNHEKGLFYGEGKLLGWQILGAIFITGWCAIWSGLFFFLLAKFDCLRVGSEVEKIGLDNYNKISKDLPDFGRGPNSPKGANAESEPGVEAENPIQKEAAPAAAIVSDVPLEDLSKAEPGPPEEQV